MTYPEIKRALWQEIALYHHDKIMSRRGEVTELIRRDVDYLATLLAEQDIDFGETGITAAALGFIAGIRPAGAR